MARFGSFLGFIALSLGAIYLIGLAIEWTSPFIPWRAVYDALPVLVVVFVVITFFCSVLSKENRSDS